MAFEFNEEYERQFQWLLKRYPTTQACLLPRFLSTDPMSSVR